MSEFIRCGDGNFVVNGILPYETCAKIMSSLDADREIVIDSEEAKFTCYPVPGSCLEDVNKTIQDLFQKYMDMVPEVPLPSNLEIANVKIYSEGGFMRLHADAVSRQTCHRMLGFLFYLNDGYEGGQTRYPNYDIKGNTGDCLIFLPLWDRVHEALPVTHGRKAVMTCYLTF